MWWLNIVLLRFIYTFFNFICLTCVHHTEGCPMYAIRLCHQYFIRIIPIFHVSTLWEVQCGQISLFHSAVARWQELDIFTENWYWISQMTNLFEIPVFLNLTDNWQHCFGLDVSMADITYDTIDRICNFKCMQIVSNYIYFLCIYKVYRRLFAVCIYSILVHMASYRLCIAERWRRSFVTAFKNLVYKMSFHMFGIEYSANCSDDDTKPAEEDGYPDNGYTCCLCNTSYEKGELLFYKGPFVVNLLSKQEMQGIVEYSFPTCVVFNLCDWFWCWTPL